MGINGLMVANSDLFYTLILRLGHRRHMLRENDTVRPGRRPVLRRIESARPLIKLISRQERDQAFLAVLEHVMAHAMNV